jgi:hypothetical protein
MGEAEEAAERAGGGRRCGGILEILLRERVRRRMEEAVRSELRDRSSTLRAESSRMKRAVVRSSEGAQGKTLSRMVVEDGAACSHGLCGAMSCPAAEPALLALRAHLLRVELGSL